MELKYTTEVSQHNKRFGEVEYGNVLVSSNDDRILSSAQYIVDDSQYMINNSVDKNPKGVRQSVINENILDRLAKVEAGGSGESNLTIKCSLDEYKRWKRNGDINPNAYYLIINMNDDDEALSV